VVYSACLFMHYWAGLYKGDMQEKTKVGADIMMKVALGIREKPSMEPGRKMIMDGSMQVSGVRTDGQSSAGQASVEDQDDSADPLWRVMHVLWLRIPCSCSVTL
jgi:hypothetical protein